MEIVADRDSEIGKEGTVQRFICRVAVGGVELLSMSYLEEYSRSQYSYDRIE